MEQSTSAGFPICALHTAVERTDTEIFTSMYSVIDFLWVTLSLYSGQG